MGEGGKSKVKSLVSRPLPTVARVTEKEEKARNGISLVFQSVRRLRDWSKLATAGVKQHFLLVDREIAAVLAAAALSFLSWAKRSDSPLLRTSAVDTTSSIMSAPSIFSVSAVARLSLLAPAAPFRNVTGV